MTPVDRKIILVLCYLIPGDWAFRELCLTHMNTLIANARKNESAG